MTDDESLAAAIYEDVSLALYDPTWIKAFEAECFRLRELLPGKFVAIEHIGSTAVPGLIAKPVVDIMAGIESMVDAQATVDFLCMNGYTTSKDFNDSMIDRKWLMRWHNGHRTHHLHIVILGSEPWNERLAFRDALRRDQKVADCYVELKTRLATEHTNDREAYTTAKNDFVRSVVRSEVLSRSVDRLPSGPFGLQLFRDESK